MPVHIRPAQISDIAALVAIESAVFDGDRISRRSFRSMVSSSSAAILVATDGAEVIGYCAVLFRAGSRKARLYSLAVAPSKTGIGRGLLGAAEAIAADRGSAHMRLEVRADNQRAIALYERSGFRLFAEISDYYADGATALRFEKTLSPEDAQPPVTGTAAP